MNETPTSGRTRPEPPPLGRVLKHWRRVRGFSQLDLALRAEVSTRHLSFVESGRSRPSREMVLLLANALGLPLRERNDLLEVAGYARVYRESALSDPHVEPARRALELILAHQEPFPAVVMDRHWNLTDRNRGAERLFGLLLDRSPRTAGSAESAPPNVVRLMFDPRGLRPFVRDWEVVAASLVQRVRDEAVGGILDGPSAALLEEVLAWPDVPASIRSGRGLERPAPLVPVRFAKDGLELGFFSTVTTLGTPRDVTLQEIRIECFFPADEATRAWASNAT